MGSVFFGKNMKLKATQQLLRIRDYLQAISQISFSFSTLNRSYPMNTLSESEGDDLFSAYLELTKKIKGLSNQFENEYEQYVRG